MLITKNYLPETNSNNEHTCFAVVQPIRTAHARTRPWQTSIHVCKRVSKCQALRTHTNTKAVIDNQLTLDTRIIEFK